MLKLLQRERLRDHAATQDRRGILPAVAWAFRLLSSRSLTTPSTEKGDGRRVAISLAECSDSTRSRMCHRDGDRLGMHSDDGLEQQKTLGSGGSIEPLLMPAGHPSLRRTTRSYTADAMSARLRDSLADACWMQYTEARIPRTSATFQRPSCRCERLLTIGLQVGPLPPSHGDPGRRVERRSGSLSYHPSMLQLPPMLTGAGLNVAR
jgi:hypothetical protein